MKLVEIGKVCTLVNGRAFKPIEWSDEGTPIIRIQNLNDEKKPFNHCKLNVDERYHVFTGDLLFSWSGTPGTSFGAFFWNRGFAYLNQHIFKVHVNEKLISKDYFKLSVNSILQQIIDQAHGGVGLKHITKGKLEATQIPLPSLEEQKRIAEILDRAEALKQKRQKALELVDEYLRATFLDLFGDPITNSKGWEKKAISHFGDIITGNTPSRNEPAFYDGEFIEWVKTDNINPNKMYVEKAKEYLSEKGSQKGRIVKPGALLVTCIAGSATSIGNSCLVDREVAFNQQINAIQPNQDVNPDFLFVLFKVAKSYIQSRATTSMKKIITKGVFEKIELILPPKPEQDKFEQIVKKVEALKAKMQTSETEIEHLAKSLSQKAFRGELTGN